MSILVIALIVIALVIGVVIGPTDASGDRPLISCHNVVIGAFACYVVLPAVLIAVDGGNYLWASRYNADGEFTKTLLLFLFALIVFIYGTSLQRLGKRPVDAPKLHSRSAQDRDVPVLVPFILIAIGALLKLYVVVSLGGVSDTVARLSGGASERLDLQKPVASLVALRTMSGIADGTAVWLFMTAMRARRSLFMPSILLGLVLAASYLTIGKRLTLLIPILALILALHRYRTPVRLRAAPIAAIALGALGMTSLLLRIYIPANIANISISLEKTPWAKGSLLSFYFRSLEFATVEMTSVSIQSRDRIVAMFHGPWQTFYTTNLEPFLYGIPRAVFPFKPDAFYDLSYATSGILLGQNATDVTVGYASTYVGASYTIGGLVGVAVVSMTLGWVVGKIDARNINTGCEGSVAGVIGYAVAIALTFQFVRQGTLGWTFIVTIVQQYGFLLAILILMAFQSSKMDHPKRRETKRVILQ